MDQPASSDRGPEDVLSMGEEEGRRSPRWGPLLAVLVVLLVGLGAYRVVSGPSTPAAPQPAAAAEQQSSPVVAQNGRIYSESVGEDKGTSARLGSDVVTLRGPGSQEAHREISVDALGRLRDGWLVKLTSTACEDRTDSRVTYGVARASGRYTAWDSDSTARRPVWRSPDRALVIIEDGRRVEVRRGSNGKVVAAFRNAV